MLVNLNYEPGTDNPEILNSGSQFAFTHDLIHVKGDLIMIGSHAILAIQLCATRWPARESRHGRIEANPKSNLDNCFNLFQFASLVSSSHILA
jgi:hypothetical protein